MHPISRWYATMLSKKHLKLHLHKRCEMKSSMLLSSKVVARIFHMCKFNSSADNCDIQEAHWSHLIVYVEV
jgi:hypothetical protein